MLISLDELVIKYGIQFKGILHVGAHECEELPLYEKYISRDKILWVEALCDKVDKCKRIYPGVQIENAVVSDKEEYVVFNIANNGQSSSILEFGYHSMYHPEVRITHKHVCKSTLLENILPKYPDTTYNFLNFDIQGAELKALKGMGHYLENVDYVYAEVNNNYVYARCALVGELDEFLKPYGLVRVETKWTPFLWGDAFYLKMPV